MKKKRNFSKLIRFGLTLLALLGIGFMIVFFVAPKSWTPEAERDVTGDTQMEKIESLVRMINERKENENLLHLSFVSYNTENGIWYFSLFVMERTEVVFTRTSSNELTTSFVALFTVIEDVFVRGSSIVVGSEGISLKVIFEDIQEIAYFTKKASAIRASPSDWSIYVESIMIGASDSQEQQKENTIFINPNR